MYRYAVLILSGFTCLAGDVLAQVSADKELLAGIQKIRAVDNHSHAMPARRPAPAESRRPDPLGKTAFPYPVRLRVTNMEYLQAWHALYGYRHQDMTDDHAREALAAKLRLMEQKGQDYPSWVLDQAGIEVTLVNAPNLGDGQSAPRFLWVPLADGFLFPFVPDQGAERAGWALSFKFTPASVRIPTSTSAAPTRCSWSRFSTIFRFETPNS